MCQFSALFTHNPSKYTFYYNKLKQEMYNKNVLFAFPSSFFFHLLFFSVFFLSHVFVFLLSPFICLLSSFIFAFLPCVILFILFFFLLLLYYHHFHFTVASIVHLLIIHIIKLQYMWEIGSKYIVLFLFFSSSFFPSIFSHSFLLVSTFILPFPSFFSYSLLCFLYHLLL